jgi:hypothetical protein
MSVAVGLTFREEGFGSGEKLKTREKWAWKYERVGKLKRGTM